MSCCLVRKDGAEREPTPRDQCQRTPNFENEIAANNNAGSISPKFMVYPGKFFFLRKYPGKYSCDKKHVLHFRPDNGITRIVNQFTALRR
jgi:hypothetical protein